MENTLKRLREEHGKSRREIAAALKIAYSTYANYEQGIRRISLEQVLILAKFYNATEKEIIEAQLNSCLCAQ